MSKRILPCTAMLTALLLAACGAGKIAHAQENWPPPRQIDEARLQRQGLRVLHGKHLTLVTDLPSSPEVDQLPKVFDAAVPRWAERFEVRESKLRNWRVLGCLIQDGDRFEAAGLAPNGGIQFPHGLSKGHELWIKQQHTDYYTRHLLLHEGTHSFMATQLGSCGPGWYMEGMAELLGMHTWDGELGALSLGVMLPDGPDARAAGRVGLLKAPQREQAALPITGVMKIDNSRIMPDSSYAWVWALAELLDKHPRYQERFRELHDHVLNPDFDQRFRRAYARDWSDLSLEWRLMLATLEYGHDIPREAIEFLPGEPVPPNKVARTTLLADRGWQSTGLLLEEGRTYRLLAKGRFTIATLPDGRPVPCEAGGVTLEYHAGRPLGVLLAAIDSRDGDADEAPATAKGGFLKPAKLGAAAQFKAPRTGTLYLRVNDSPAKLSDNAGELQITLGGGQSPAD